MRMTEEQEQEVIYNTGYAQALKDVGEYVGKMWDESYDYETFMSWLKEFYEALRQGKMPKEMK